MDEILARLTTGGPLAVSERDLRRLLAASRVVREEQAGPAGVIRILDLDGTLIVQEQTPGGATLLRRRETLEEAAAFVDSRLETYDRMWDGCGCKVDYDEP